MNEKIFHFLLQYDRSQGQIISPGKIGCSPVEGSSLAFRILATLLLRSTLGGVFTTQDTMFVLPRLTSYKE